MSTDIWTAEDSVRARQFWEEYQRQHDLSDRKGQAVGIDPKTGRVWFGESMIDIGAQMDAENCFTPLLFLRVGQNYYKRKGCGLRSLVIASPTTPATRE